MVLAPAPALVPVPVLLWMLVPVVFEIEV